jgi:hypothetical protein
MQRRGKARSGGILAAAVLLTAVAQHFLLIGDLARLGSCKDSPDALPVTGATGGSCCLFLERALHTSEFCHAACSTLPRACDIIAGCTQLAHVVGTQSDLLAHVHTDEWDAPGCQPPAINESSLAHHNCHIETDVCIDQVRRA